MIRGDNIMVDVSRAFSGMAEAEIYGAGVYFSEGEFKVRSKSFKINDGYRGSFSSRNSR